ncbi:MAG TPA: hypothetical protein VN613_10070 [Gemmatimonadaceae bacterium]|nr:hypothetical protein [Gemmatimonadaceae bacterium]
MNRRLSVVLAVLVAAGAGACAESLDGGAGCPRLCPAQTLAVLDTVINPILAFDSTFSGYPEIGTEQELLLATRGDTLETRGVIRFDTITTTITPANDTAQTITQVDSAFLRIVLDTAHARIPANIRFEVYDVDDTVEPDTLSAPVNAHFAPSRRIGGITVARAFLPETLSVPLSDSAILAKMTSRGRLRVGLRVDGDGPAWIRVGSTVGSAGAILTYRGSPDTTVAKISVTPVSNFPGGTLEEGIRQDLTNYMIIAKNAIPQFTNTINVGGNPGRRPYLRFNIPSHIVDSSTIVRATLILTQRPQTYGDLRDTMTVHAQVVLAGPQVTDLRRAANIISAPGLDVNDSLLISPRDSGQKMIDMFLLLRAWATQDALLYPPPRALVLRASPENVLPFEASFFNTQGPAALRPQMRISYIPKITYGVP